MSKQVDINNINVARIMAEKFGHSNIFATYLHLPIIRKGVAAQRAARTDWRLLHPCRRCPFVCVHD